MIQCSALSPQTAAVTGLAQQPLVAYTLRQDRPRERVALAALVAARQVGTLVRVLVVQETHQAQAQVRVLVAVLLATLQQAVAVAPPPQAQIMSAPAAAARELHPASAAVVSFTPLVVLSKVIRPRPLELAGTVRRAEVAISQVVPVQTVSSSYAMLTPSQLPTQRRDRPPLRWQVATESTNGRVVGVSRYEPLRTG